MRKGPRPVFQLLFYPATDMTTRRRSRDVFADGFFLTDDDMTWFLDHYCPDVDQRHDPRLSVLLADDLRGLPPASPDRKHDVSVSDQQCVHKCGRAGGSALVERVKAVSRRLPLSR